MFSFGVVILEIITGQPVILRVQGQENTHIIQWVSSKVAQGDVKIIADSKMQGEFDTGSVWKAVEAAMACVSTDPNQRPNMSDVVKEMKECLAMEIARSGGGHAGQDTENSSTSNEFITMNVTTELSPRPR